MRVGLLGSGLTPAKLGTIFARVRHEVIFITHEARTNSGGWRATHKPRARRHGDVMSNKKIWFITGTSRGIDVDFAKAALGLFGFEFCTAYAASKFGLEGWMESLHAEVAPFDSHHYHRQPRVLPHGAPPEAIDELRRAVHRGYDERRVKQLEFWKAQNGQQSGDPAKLARALIMIGSQEPPPGRELRLANLVILRGGR
jgi:hypothetical protein